MTVTTKLTICGIAVLLLTATLLMVSVCWGELFWAYWLIGVALACCAVALLMILWRLADENPPLD